MELFDAFAEYMTIAFGFALEEVVWPLDILFILTFLVLAFTRLQHSFTSCAIPYDERPHSHTLT